MEIKITYTVDIQERWCEVFSDGRVVAHADGNTHAFSAETPEQGMRWASSTWLDLEGEECHWSREDDRRFTQKYIRAGARKPTTTEISAYLRAKAKGGRKAAT